jgi:hypothetical protein
MMRSWTTLLVFAMLLLVDVGVAKKRKGGKGGKGARAAPSGGGSAGAGPQVHTTVESENPNTQHFTQKHPQQPKFETIREEDIPEGTPIKKIKEGEVRGLAPRFLCSRAGGAQTPAVVS